MHEPYIKHIEDRIWEMRLRGRDGIARAVYVTAPGRRVVILPVFTKKTQKTPRREIELARQRATVSGRTFQVSPPWIWVTLTTALFERMVKHAARHTIISGPPAGSERGVPAHRSR